MSAADDLIARVITREGPPQDIGDGKGITRWGQTPGWLTQFHLPIPLTAAEAAANYKNWLEQTHLILVVGATADDLADIVIDIAVMSSHEKGIKALQAALIYHQPTHHPQVGVDGVLGPDTLAALAGADRDQLAREVIAWDMEYQGQIISLNPAKLARWAHGWARRLADHVRSLS